MQSVDDVIRLDEIPEDVRNMTAAMERAADRARRIAVQTNTPLVLWRDGKIVHVMPDGTEVQP